MFSIRKNRINLDSFSVKLDIRDNKYATILRMLQLTELDLKYLKSLKKLVSDNLSEITDVFYSSISVEENLLEIINKYSTVDKLKQKIAPHILEMFDGVIDSQYLDKRKRVALAHVNINLPSESYVGSFTSIMTYISSLIENEIKYPVDRLNSLLALSRIISLEQRLVLLEFDAVLDKQNQEIKENKDKLSNSIIESSSSLATISEETNASYHQLKEQAHNILEFVMRAK